MTNIALAIQSETRAAQYLANHQQSTPVELLVRASGNANKLLGTRKFHGNNPKTINESQLSGPLYRGLSSRQYSTIMQSDNCELSESEFKLE